MKMKGNLTDNALPLYEVTELTQDEALLAISDNKADKTIPGMLSSEALKRYYSDLVKDQSH